MTNAEKKDFLDDRYEKYNTADFIADDPIQIPHRFSIKQDIEIAGYLTATISWGQRKTILKNANRMMEFMDHSPYDFIKNHQEVDLKKVMGFVHRTFQDVDLLFFIGALQNVYSRHDSLEELFAKPIQEGGTMKESISYFRAEMFKSDHLPRSEKHISNPMKNSSAKRIHMFLRWMVRKDTKGVDFGLWNSIPTSQLMLPLDVHTAGVSRKLNLLKRKQHDWKAVEELTASLRKFDPLDPVKYDFALFGLGVYEGFSA